MWSTALHYGSERAISQVSACCGGNCRCWLCRSFKPAACFAKTEREGTTWEAVTVKPTLPYWQYIEPVTFTPTPLQRWQQHWCSQSRRPVWSRFMCTLSHCVFYHNNNTLNICLPPPLMSYHGTMHECSLKTFPPRDRKTDKQEKANSLFILKHGHFAAQLVVFYGN